MICLQDVRGHPVPDAAAEKGSGGRSSLEEAAAPVRAAGVYVLGGPGAGGVLGHDERMESGDRAGGNFFCGVRAGGDSSKSPKEGGVR